MSRKRILLLAAVLAVLGVLLYLQIRAWRRFDWGRFKEGAENINYWRVLLAVGFIYVADGLRAIRWKIFLRPSRPKATSLELVAPQYIGFTGLALLGRPGEFVRPYLISKKVHATMASQVAIWLVERVFDTCAVVLLFAIDIFSSSSLRELDRYESWRKLGYAAAPVIVALIYVVWAMWARGPAIASWVCRRTARVSQSFADALEKKLRALSAGLHTIKDGWSLLQVSALSMVIWCLVAFAYRSVTHAFPPDTGLPDLNLPEVVLLMFASVAGGVLQLPLVGGGSQLATIAVLSQTFGYADAPELAVTCGMLLWLVTFMSIIPVGLFLMTRGHVSLTRLTEESEAEAQTERAGGPSLPLP